MPKCVDCGTESEQLMYGPPDQLRCSACVEKLNERMHTVYAPVHGTEALARPYVVYAIIGLSLVLTLCYWGHLEFVGYLVEVPTAVWDGQLWRLLTSTFLHADIIHLAFNLYWLWQFGTVLEHWMGRLRFLGFFVLSALASSAAQFMFDTGGIGLSGVGYALFGLLFALRRDKDFAAAQMQPGVVQLFVGWFFLCILLTATHVWHVGNVAHGAGAVIGWLIGQAVLRRQRVLLVSGLTVLLLAFSGLTMYMPWNGLWAWHRGAQALRNGDRTAALYWYRRAADAHPENAELQHLVRMLQNAGPLEDE